MCTYSITNVNKLMQELTIYNVYIIELQLLASTRGKCLGWGGVGWILFLYPICKIILSV
jgi:hypothetical protein